MQRKIFVCKAGCVAVALVTFLTSSAHAQLLFSRTMTLTHEYDYDDDEGETTVRDFFYTVPAGSSETYALAGVDEVVYEVLAPDGFRLQVNGSMLLSSFLSFQGPSPAPAFAVPTVFELIDSIDAPVITVGVGTAGPNNLFFIAESETAAGWSFRGMRWTLDVSGESNPSLFYFESGYARLFRRTIEPTDPGDPGPQAELVPDVPDVSDLASLADLLTAITGPGADAVQDAIDNIIGNNGGQANNGAVDKLDAGNLNAALVKIRKAIEALEVAEAADPGLDLTSAKTTLAAAAKDVAQDAVDQAAAVANTPDELMSVQDAMVALAVGDALLGTGSYVSAVILYQVALQNVQGIVP